MRWSTELLSFTEIITTLGREIDAELRPASLG